MHGTYLQNKNSIYNYRAKNLEIIKERDCKNKRWKRIQMIYLAILLN